MADGSEGSGLEFKSGVRVHLHPFLHQVGGSTLMFKFDADTICKPLLPKEYNFYKVVPESLKQFTARYKGMFFYSDSKLYGLPCIELI